MAMLKELREKAGFSQEELADRAHVSLELIKRIEGAGGIVKFGRGKEGDFDAAGINRIADALGCSAEDFISPLTLRRLEAGYYSVGDLSSEIDIPVRTIRAYEHGDLSVSRMRYDRLMAYAKALNCQPEDMIKADGKK